MTTAKKKALLISIIIILTSIVSYSTGPGVKVSHKNVQRLTTGATNLHIQYSPKLHIDHGCEPFAAVDDSGNYNSGLKDSGAHNGQCKSSPNGQVYARSLCKESFCGHMYVYYMPKDNGFPFPFLGHRHDFEEVVIWTQNNNIIGAAYSSHGDYKYYNNPHMSEGRVNVAYDLSGFTHSMKKIENMDKGKGSVWPIASWELMTDSAKSALSDPSNFPNTNFAAKDSNFTSKLNKARLSNVTVTF